MYRKFPWIKFIIGIALFAIFHQLYDLFPNTLTNILAEGPKESIFAHMKMLFYPYLLICIGEFLLLRRSGAVKASFWYARLLILVSVPWMMISLFYVPQALGIFMEGTLELVFSILISWIGIYMAIRFEEPFEAIDYRPAIKALLIVLFLAALIIYTGFAFHLPHTLFFAL